MIGIRIECCRVLVIFNLNVRSACFDEQVGITTRFSELSTEMDAKASSSKGRNCSATRRCKPFLPTIIPPSKTPVTFQ
jgi:hypothetical protein